MAIHNSAIDYRRGKSTVKVYDAAELTHKLEMELPRNAEEFYTMFGKKTIVAVSSNRKGRIMVRSYNRSTLESGTVMMVARMHLLSFLPEQDELWFVKEDELILRR